MRPFRPPLAEAATCTWCGTHYPRHQRNCTNCGGPLPGPTPPDPGPEPPPPPREIPRAYVRHLYLGGNVPAIVGGAFVAVAVPAAGIPLALAFNGVPEAGWFALLGGLFGLIGGPLLAMGVRRAQHQVEALERGVARAGQIVDLHQDTSESINGRHPWAVTYAYDVGGRRHQGRIRSWAPAGVLLAHYAVGSPVHVLALPDDPAVSALYPPIR